MNDKFGKSLPLLMLVGLLLGFVFGYFMPGASLAIDFVGRLFLGVFRFLVVPLLLASAISGLATLTEQGKSGRTSLVFFSYVVATTIIAAVVAVCVGLVFSPAYHFAGVPANPLEATWVSVSDALGDIIPANPLRAVAEGKYLGLILLGSLLGAGLVALGIRGRSVVSLFRGLHDGLLRVVQLVLYAAPLGLLSLVAAAVARQGEGLEGWMTAGSAYLGVTFAALVVHGLIALPLIAWYFAGRVPWRLYNELSAAFLTALGTGSKAATFPVTSHCLNERSRLDTGVISSVLPLSTVLNLSGSTIVMVSGTLFVAQSFGAGLGVGQIIALAFLAAILSLAAAGMPSSMLLAAPVLFGVVGLSAEQMALAFPAIVVFDWLVDRMAAAVNVGSDAVAVAVVAQHLGGAPVRRPSRARRTSREDGDIEHHPRRSQTSRAGGPRVASHSDRGRSEGRERGRSDARPSGRPLTPEGRGVLRLDSSERSPFQMRTGRTPAFSSAPEQPAGNAERTQPDRGRQEQPERRFSSRPDSLDGRRPQGRQRSRFERDVDEEARGPRRQPEPLEPPPDSSADSESRRMSREAVARDLARISAQLGKEGGNEPPVDSSPMTVKERDDETLFTPLELESVRKDIARMDAMIMDETDSELSSDDVPADHAEDEPEIGESADLVSEGSQDSEEPEPPRSFGRRRSFRGAAFRRHEASSEDEAKKAETETPPSGYSSENLAFGRIKRKNQKL